MLWYIIFLNQSSHQFQRSRLDSNYSLLYFRWQRKETINIYCFWQMWPCFNWCRYRAFSLFSVLFYRSVQFDELVQFSPGLLILQKYFPLKAHISPRIMATASNPVWHSSGGSLLLDLEVVFLAMDIITSIKWPILLDSAVHLKTVLVQQFCCLKLVRQKGVKLDLPKGSF